MKKMSAIFAFLCVFSAAAMAADVYSVNAVGYYNIVLPASNKYVMVGPSFDSVTGAVERTLLDIFGTNSGLRQNGSPSKVDRLYLWDLAAQQYVIFGQNTNGLFYLTTAWSGAPTNPVVPRGYGFFVKSPSASSGGSNDTVITLAGQVPSVGSNVLSVIGATPTAPYQFLCNPYPVRMSYNDLINTNNGATAGDTPSKCDRIYTWDTATQQYVIIGLKSVTNSWVYTSSFTMTNMPVLYCEPGQGFFYRGKTNFTWSTSKPYVWP